MRKVSIYIYIDIKTMDNTSICYVNAEILNSNVSYYLNDNISLLFQSS